MSPSRTSIPDDPQAQHVSPLRWARHDWKARLTVNGLATILGSDRVKRREKGSLGRRQIRRTAVEVAKERMPLWYVPPQVKPRWDPQP